MSREFFTDRSLPDESCYHHGRYRDDGVFAAKDSELVAGNFAHFVRVYHSEGARAYKTKARNAYFGERGNRRGRASVS